MVDRTPQQFLNGDPDGVTDNTAAIQAAINAWQPGDQVVLSGGTFRIASGLLIPDYDMVLRGDAAIMALDGFSGSTMITMTGHGVVFDADGLQLDQADNIPGGVTLAASGALGLEVGGAVSRNTAQAFLRLGSHSADVLVQGCDHLGQGYGVIAMDAEGLTGITLRGNRFEHPGIGATGDGVRISCPTHGASGITVIDCKSVGYIGRSNDEGNGFSFSRIVGGRILGCRALQCEGDGFRLEHECRTWLCADLQALDVGVADALGDSGSGLIAYDSDDITVALVSVRNCSFHGIALSGQGRSEGLDEQLRLNGIIERCDVDSVGRDGIHLTTQRAFRVDRNRVRDPSLDNPGVFAGIHVSQQGGAAFENVEGVGSGNSVVLSGASTPLGTIVIREASIDVTIDGVSSSGIAGEPFADGSRWSDATGWIEAA
jgi:hypothetical protein